MDSLELEQAVDEYGEHLLKMAFFYLRDREAAKDIVQDVFISYYNNPNYEEQGKLRAYLTKMTINRCKDYLRSWSFRHLKLSKNWIDSIHTEQDALILQEERTELAVAVLGLPIKYREIIIFYYYEEYNMREIAAFLHLSENTVKTRMIKARKLLKDQLTDENWEVLSDE
ncbi:RNA polymerase subunit sigma [Sporosarcina sp. NCCP-2331]|nr:RNA polymerase subunit sigma [Sporosarcina sp. NCCP-2331]GLB57276.1 RNA polymerase subunit sigma [Sporosarcina sp. NCCP-2378]